VILGGGTTIDFLAPMRGVFRHLKKVHRDPRVVSASLFMVHPYTSAEDLGWAVHVSTDADPELAARLADELADRAWAERGVAMPKLRTVAEAADEVVTSPWRRIGPVTLVDVDDIVGAGAPGGNTHFVRELSQNDRGLVSLVPLHDPAAVEATWAVPLGEKASVVLRGTPGYGQPEVSLTATVACRRVGDFGRVVRLSVGGLHVALSERPPLPVHPKFWRELGVEPRKADIVVQKNFFHYRMFYAAISFSHIPTVSQGATSFERVRTRRYRVPVHPEARLTDWRASDAALRAGRALDMPPPR
jgi:microcystin degradation protein MlrC